ncbi:short-chain dehydrogenase [Heyndrickxia camelliae]|uniref:Short-chain dehydrogenase n=1 Tax=Heyndrickxia camelliae TaxID=1707093 RepID=A0A2N3LGT1_9BACI|nr:short-chain dehydrogenase [Heyndrickxia camelliae]PKR83777.1 short-chain dehydrogenase [Heyndrickxia camelliae]
MKHALIVGGTGMLSEVTLFLKKEGYFVSVIGRDSSKYERLSDSPHSTFLSVDYHDDAHLLQKIQYTIRQHGPLHLIVAWIHSSAPNALGIVLKEAAKTSKEFRLFHVLGSSSHLEKIKEAAAVPKNCLYRQVQLGFILEDNQSRWLFNHEISFGVIQAIQEDNPVKVIGVLQPWEKRP